jgi:hypothetical protein
MGRTHAIGIERLCARPCNRPAHSFRLKLGLEDHFLAVHAARLAASGCGPDEILASVQELANRTHSFAALDTLEYLRKGGRVNLVMFSVGTLLKNNPELLMLTPQAARLAEASQSLKNARTIVSLSSQDLPQGSELLGMFRGLLPCQVGDIRFFIFATSNAVIFYAGIYPYTVRMDIRPNIFVIQIKSNITVEFTVIIISGITLDGRPDLF